MGVLVPYAQYMTATSQQRDNLEVYTPHGMVMGLVCVSITDVSV